MHIYWLLLEVISMTACSRYEFQRSRKFILPSSQWSYAQGIVTIRISASSREYLKKHLLYIFPSLQSRIHLVFAHVQQSVQRRHCTAINRSSSYTSWDVDISVFIIGISPSHVCRPKPEVDSPFPAFLKTCLLNIIQQNVRNPFPTLAWASTLTRPYR